MYIAALSVIPLVGLTGGAVDLSRTYLVKARLQQACDAGALAGRRSMSGTTVTDTDKQEALRYFYFNFPNGLMGSSQMVDNNAAAANHVASAVENGQFHMWASTTVPTTLLRIFNINNIRVSADCLGEEYYVNTDIMLVLDTTGSMNCYLSDALSCSQETEKATSGTNKSKMLEMRTALKTLYTNLRPAEQALKAKSLRMRIGFLQFSSTVNVGKLIRAESTGYIRSSYQYRNASGTLKTATNWDNVSNFWTTGWGGCIEERGTQTSLTATSTSIPASTWDLDISKIPDTDATRWAPYDFTTNGEQSMGSITGSNYYKAACPKPAVHMKVWDDVTAFNAQVDTITQGDGPTYHDIGINWGLRMIANDGIFGAKNPSTFNNVKVRRTIVFMTDGYMQPFRNSYSAYGVAQYAGRTAATGTSDTSLEDIHKNRFKLMCAKAKSAPYNVDIWVIAVLSGQTMDAEISSCASNADQALPVSNATDLANAFKKISDKVGNLRLGR